MTAKATETVHRLHYVEISQFQCLTEKRVDANGNHICVSGRNGAGKSSFLKAILWGLGAIGDKEVPEPIHEGADRAAVKQDYGAFTVERVATAGGKRWTVTAKDGSKIKDAGDFLASLRGRYAVNPGAFLSARPQDQIADVLNVFGVHPPVQQVQKITGEMHPARDGETADSYLGRLCADETGLYYHRRRDAHRTAEQKVAALREQWEVVQRLGGPLEPGEKPQSAGEIMDELKRLQTQDDAKRAAEREYMDACEEHAKGKEIVRGLEQDARRKDAEIAELERRLADAKKERQSLAVKIRRGADMLHMLEETAKTEEANLRSIPDPASAIEIAREKLGALERTNAAVQKRQLACEQSIRLAAESDAATAEHKKLDDVMTALRDVRANLLNGLDLGVQGLSIADGELRLNGKPFKQGSTAERLEVACVIAMREKPALRLLWVDDGEHFDQESRELLFRLANENGFEVIFAAVKDDEPLKIELVEAA